MITVILFFIAISFLSGGVLAEGYKLESTEGLKKIEGQCQSCLRHLWLQEQIYKSGNRYCDYGTLSELKVEELIATEKDYDTLIPWYHIVVWNVTPSTRTMNGGNLDDSKFIIVAVPVDKRLRTFAINQDMQVYTCMKYVVDDWNDVTMTDLNNPDLWRIDPDKPGAYYSLEDRVVCPNPDNNPLEDITEALGKDAQSVLSILGESMGIGINPQISSISIEEIDKVEWGI